jgi:transketolase
VTRSTTLSPPELDELCINTLRFLAVDMVQKANSGHPGLPLGSAAMAYTLWDRFMRVNPADPHWFNRDRFVLSAGHGCALLYALLHVTGFDLPLAELQRFRQWDSRTPGHPEYGKTPGVEATTGPLGQGFGNAVGMAITEASLAARYNRPGHAIVEHDTYVLVSDGDLMEGVSSEAASLAGHLRLGRLIVLYADNLVSLEGSTNLAFTEDRAARFAAYGWHVQRVEDGNAVALLTAAIESAREEKGRPSFIDVHTHIGYGSPHKHDTSAAHGEPLGVEEVRLTKEHLDWPVEPSFDIPLEAADHFRELADRGAARQAEWESQFRSYAGEYPALAADFQRVLQQQLPDGWAADLPDFRSARGSVATRVASGEVLNALARKLPELMGGAADLAPSTHTLIEQGGNFQSDKQMGRNIHFGVREHAMGAILNGMALHRGVIPYGATFLIFSDYMRPPMRLAAMNGLPVIYIFTHDSIAMGEDGPTHQPVEQLLGLRSVPGLIEIRPADANETAAAWRIAVESRDRPTALVLTRQKLPVLDLARYPGLSAGVLRGGYILADTDADPRVRETDSRWERDGGQVLVDADAGARLDIVLIATGSEVHLALEARDKLAGEGVRARVVSLPSWSLFKDQPEAYRTQVLPEGIPTLAIEAGTTLGWHSYIGLPVAVIGVDRFGSSAPGEVVMREYGFTVEHVCGEALALLQPARRAKKA